MKHEQSEILKVYADNKALVIFIKTEGEWVRTNPRALIDYVNGEFFACLPQHKEACLHWLNGGDVEEKYRGGWSGIVCGDTDYPKQWRAEHGFMQGSFMFRIKLKKEKRWIVFSTDSESVVTTFDNPMIAKDSLGSDNGYQIIEIEVEV